MLYHEFIVSTRDQEELIEITHKIEEIVQKSGISDGLCLVYVPHATAGVIINESADPNIKRDFLSAINKMIPRDAGYLHDRIDNNAHSHIKAAIIGPSVTIPVQGGYLKLGTWQEIMLCEFDGPRSKRQVIVSLLVG